MAMHLRRRAPSLSFAEAYHAAQSFLVHIGAAPTRLDERTDGIVEFSGNDYMGRLRYETTVLKQGAVLALLKRVDDESTTPPILFSATDFTSSAEVFATHRNVALFTITPTGDVVPRSPAAEQLMPEEPFEAPFAVDEPAEDDDDLPGGVWVQGLSEIADHEWLVCRVCGTTHHPDAAYCHKCGTALDQESRGLSGARSKRSGSTRGALPLEMKRTMTTTATLRCRNCGSTDIES